MKALTVLFDEHTEFENEKVFGGKSALELCTEFFEGAEFLPAGIENGGVDLISKENLRSGVELLAKIYQLAREKNADFIIYSYADLPFLNADLTKKLVQTHVEYKCEYTFADGFPYGFAPELIDTGALGILLELCKTTAALEASKPVERGSLYNMIKTDINSFEVEAELSETDWRLYRFNFCCKNRDSFIQCQKLFELVKDDADGGLSRLDVEKACEKASKSCAVLKTVPSFYNIQICGGRDTKPLYEADSVSDAGGLLKKDSVMSFEKFAALCKKISEFSGSAVLNLGYLGEPLCHKEFLLFVKEVLKYEGLSVFLETSGLFVTEELCKDLRAAASEASERTNGYQKLMIAVKLDAVSAEVYAKVNGTEKENFNKALAGCDALCKALPGMVYPQFTRMNENENELEAFFRYWNEKTNPSVGNCIIQKYNDFSGLLPDCKPADLSPVERNVCWHLRRDMSVLADGSAVLCPNMLFSQGCRGEGHEEGQGEGHGKSLVLGNAFEEALSEIWKKSDSMVLDHISQKYCDCCGKCDEYYTFNF